MNNIKDSPSTLVGVRTVLHSIASAISAYNYIKPLHVCQTSIHNMKG
jgi:hypothetical protein